MLSLKQTGSCYGLFGHKDVYFHESSMLGGFFTVVQPLSHVRFFATPWIEAHQPSLSFTMSWSLLKLMSTVSDATQPSHPLFSPSPPALNLSQHQGIFH